MMHDISPILQGINPMNFKTPKKNSLQLENSLPRQFKVCITGVQVLSNDDTVNSRTEMSLQPY
jgi:hypothetical protein